MSQALRLGAAGGRMAQVVRLCRRTIMRRAVIVVFVLAVPVAAVSVPRGGPGGFGWTISNSPTDPFSLSGDPVGTSGTLYLWISCYTGITGAIGSEFALESPDGIQVLSIVGSTPSFVFTGPASDLVGTFSGYLIDITMVGIITVTDTGGHLCFGPSATNGRNSTFGVDGGTYTHYWEGWRSTSGPPCWSATWCSLDVVDERRWGRIKSNYR